MTIGVLRARKEAIKATEAQRRASEVLSSVFEEMGNAGMAAISYHRQREMLTQLLNSINEMAAACERLDQQINTLSPQQVVALESQARQALDIGRGDLAQAASARKAEIERQLSDLAAHRRWLRAEEEKLTTAYEQLAAKG
jgi:phage shock protein A